MALLNPVNALIVPFLFLTTIPLALFASITTLLAFSVLSLRVIVVYLDLALSMLPRPLIYTATLKQSSIASSTASVSSLPNSRSSSPTLLHRRRRRRSSATSLISAGSATSLTDSRGLGLMPSVGPARDYEGIGGWRVGTSADDEAWTSVSNPRLELPIGDPHHHHHRQHHLTNSSGTNKLYHHRSLSGGPVTPGDVGYLMMKARTRSPEAMTAARIAMPPNSSRARTPPVTRSAGLGALGDSYFPASNNSHSPKTTRRPSISAAADQ